MSLNFYVVRRGDEVFRIMRAHYGDAKFFADQASLTANLQANNPHIPNIDLIFPGQVIMLPDTPANAAEMVCVVPDLATASGALAKTIAETDGVTQSIMEQLSADKLFKASGMGFLDGVTKIGESAADDIRKVGLSYYQMQAKTITRGQYDYRRQVSLKRADAKLGIMRPLLTPGKTGRQAIRIDRTAEVRTHKINKEIMNLDRVTKLAKNGAIILKVADIAESGVKIHTASNNKERTVILLDNVGTNVGAAIGSGLVTLALVGTPVGWGVIAAVAIGGVVGSIGGDLLMDAIQEETLYDADGKRINTKLDRFWKNFYD